MEYTNKDTKNDRWIVEHIFPNLYNKYFVEAGACTGIRASSCYVLEKHFQWTGICVEPNDDYFQQLKKNRNNSICEKLCLSNSNGTVTYLKGEDNVVHPMLGGIKSNLMQYRKKSQEIINKGKEVTTKSITLYELLKKHNAPKTIHYLAMDIEGSELPVLEVFPFEEYQILAISIEGKQCNNLLFSKGYINVKNPFNQDKLYEQYFVHKSIASAKNLEKTANYYVCLGKDLFHQKKLPEAIKAYSTAISIEPDSSTYSLLGVSQQQNGDLLAAINSYQKAINLDPQTPAWVYKNLGYTLQQEKRNDEAIKVYQKAIELDCQMPLWAYHSFGNALSEQKRWDEAIEVYQKAIALQPNNLQIKRNLEQVRKEREDAIASS